MKRLFLLILALGAFSSCDDGDMIVTHFAFDSDSHLNLCTSNGNNIFYIVNSDPDEAIAFRFNDTDFDGTLDANGETQTENYTLDNNNTISYRAFDGAVSGTTYFCSGIPSTEPKVTQEYNSQPGGTIELITSVLDQEADSTTNVLTTTYQTFMIGHNITLKNADKDEEIVEEKMRLGNFITTKETPLQ